MDIAERRTAALKALFEAAKKTSRVDSPPELFAAMSEAQDVLREPITHKTKVEECAPPHKDDVSYVEMHAGYLKWRNSGHGGPHSWSGYRAGWNGAYEQMAEAWRKSAAIFLEAGPPKPGKIFTVYVHERGGVHETRPDAVARVINEHEALGWTFVAMANEVNVLMRAPPSHG